jgi:hypothetical protein
VGERRAPDRPPGAALRLRPPGDVVVGPGPPTKTAWRGGRRSTPTRWTCCG